MQQAQVARFPGFGIIYPDGRNGIRVVKTFVQGPKKMVQPDGSVEWTTPPPTIHELYGGGFVYASGEPVIDRAHLESITDPKMRVRALAWFDGDKKLSEVATKDVPPLASDEEREKKKPEPLYVVSTDMAPEGAPEKLEKIEEPSSKVIDKSFSAIMETLGAIMSRMDVQDKQIAELQKTPLATIDTQKIVAQRQRKGEAMKAKWADPEFRARQKAAREAKKGNGKDSSQTNQEVPTV
jgi:hypothetical protein